MNVGAHPTKYPHVVTPIEDLKDTPDIFSWHVHILYFGRNTHDVNASMVYYQQVLKQFNLVDHCDNLFHNPRRCYFNPDTGPAGPFPTAQWAVFFLPEDFSEFVPWFLQNRGDWDVLIHPNSGYELEDHRDWSSWAGEKWPLDFSIFE